MTNRPKGTKVTKISIDQIRVSITKGMVPIKELVALSLSPI
jgi:hypothetical protein